MKFRTSLSLSIGALALIALGGSAAVADGESLAVDTQVDSEWHYGGGVGECPWWGWWCQPPAASYWDDGIVVTVDDVDGFAGVAVDADHNVYAVGRAGAGLGEERVQIVAKFSSDGQLDPAFGTGGIVRLNLSDYEGTPESIPDVTDDGDNAFEEGTAIGLTPEGDVIVVGRATLDPLNLSAPITTATGAAITITKLDGVSGVVDATFGGVDLPGTQFIDIGGPAAGSEQAYDVAVDANGGILVFSYGDNDGIGTVIPVGCPAPVSNSRDRWIHKLQPTGLPDVAYGLPCPGVNYSFYDVYQGSRDQQRHAVLSIDGVNTLSGGYTNLGGRNQVVLLMQNATTGIPEPTFSANGVLRATPFSLGWAEAYGAVQQSDGSIVTTGYGREFASGEHPEGIDNGVDVVGFRFSPEGYPDMSWSGNGAMVYNVNEGNDRGRSLVALADDQIMMAGTGNPTGTGSSPENAMLLLVTADGDVSSEFDANTHKFYDFDGADEEFRDIRRNGDFIAAVGYSRNRTEFVDDNGTPEDDSDDNYNSLPSLGTLVILAPPEDNGPGGFSGW